MKDQSYDFVLSMFRLINQRGYIVPDLNIEYVEKDTGLLWQVACGGTRVYLLRFGDSLVKEWQDQAADSYFMVERITSALLLGGAGFFKASAVGRILFCDVGSEFRWTSHFDRPDLLDEKETPSDLTEKVGDWYQALCLNNMTRRAAHDAYLALLNPHEALVFVYRGLEWLKRGQNLSWEAIAEDIGGTKKDLRELKKVANHETGVRHASQSGKKLRANERDYGPWVCDLIDAINAARARLDNSFQKMTPEEIANVVMRAMPMVPYP